ncbi:MAG: hypothetical protein WCZ21_05375 [Bacteroidales bacterium]
MKHFIIVILTLISSTAFAQLSPFISNNIQDSTWYYDFETADENPEKVQKFIFTYKINNLKKLKDYPNLEVLAIECYIKTIPKVLCELKNLKALSIPWSELTELPDNFNQLKNLEVLILNHNDFKKLPDILTQLPHLKCLHLINLSSLENPKEELERVVCNIPTLEELRYLMFSTDLTEIPEAISKLQNLKYLHIDAIHLQEIPKVLGTLTNLEELYFGTPGLSRGPSIYPEFPKELCTLKKMETLSFRDITIQAFPEEISQLTNLKKLRISIPKDFNTNSLLYLRNIHIESMNIYFESGVKLITFPPEFCEIKTLQSLHIFTYRNISKLPENFGNLVNLEYLSISCDSLRYFPESFCNLTKLNHLEFLSTCNLEQLPECINNFNNLEYLSLGKCNKLRPPIILNKLSKLKYLNISIVSGDKFDYQSYFYWDLLTY